MGRCHEIRGRWGEGLTAEKMKDCRWLQPTLVGMFEFVEWIPDDHLRHASFIGLREDKDPRSVVRELYLQVSAYPRTIPGVRPDSQSHRERRVQNLPGSPTPGLGPVKRTKVAEVQVGNRSRGRRGGIGQAAFGGSDSRGRRGSRNADLQSRLQDYRTGSDDQRQGRFRAVCRLTQTDTAPPIRVRGLCRFY